MVLTKTKKVEDRKASFNHVIEKLKFEYKSIKLTQLIEAEFGDAILSSSDIFFIKSEIKRKAQPCSRLIDLRSLSNSVTLSTFTWEKLSHVLDKPSAEHFISLTKKYGGKYTFGVYEGVISQFKLTKDQAKVDQFSHDINLDKVSLCEIYRRQEERMNLGVKVAIFPQDLMVDSITSVDIEQMITGDLRGIKKEKQVDGNTANISVNGLQVRLTKSLSVGQFIVVRFLGLESEFVFKQKYIAYKVVRTDLIEEGKIHLISLSQIALDIHDEFKQFTRRIIYSNKKRYKVRLDNTIVSVRSKFYEQFYLSRRSALDVFARRDNSLPYIFSSEPALNIVNWFSVRGVEYLSSLFEKDKITQYTPESREIYWVVLKKSSTKKAGEFGYYSGIINDELSVKFALYALKSGHGKVFKISCSQPTNKNPFITSSLPRTVHRKMDSDHIYRYSPELKNVFKELKLMYSLRELRSEDMQGFAGNNKDISKEELSACSQYFLGQKPISQSEIVRLESNDYRKEDRFDIRTGLSLAYEDKKIFGNTIDVSSRGLAIELESDMAFKVNSEIQVTFHEMNQLENEFDLTNIVYKVVFSKERLLRLEALREKSATAIKFLNKYIVSNIDTLKIVGNNEKFYGLKRVFRNIVSQSHQSIPTFFTVKDSKPCVRTLGLSSRHSNLSFWSSAFRTFSIDTQLKPLFYHSSFLKRLLLDLPNINKTKPYYHYFLLVKYKQNNNGKLDILDVTYLPVVNTISELSAALDGYEFEFSVFNVSFTKKSRMFDRYFKDEMRYLEAYAAHKAQKLTFEMKTVSGVLDFEDVTSFFDLFSSQRVLNH